jgi:hypothetical protein
VVQLLVALAVAALSGISFLAYKHPKAYAKFYLPLMILFLAIAYGDIIWDMSISDAYRMALPYIEIGKMNEATQAIRDEELAVKVPYLLLIVTGLPCYFLFLAVLPYLLVEDTA